MEISKQNELSPSRTLLGSASKTRKDIASSITISKDHNLKEEPINSPQ
jgi:hypothetical protein